MAGVAKVNFPDPLKANMGTAFHDWLDKRTHEYQQVHGISEWLTETEVWPAKFLKGHVDLYSRVRRTVLDWKTTSADNLKAWKKSGIPMGYLIQIMLYGKGMINLGHQVDRVGLIGISRSGTLRDVAVLTVPYDENVSISALRRVWGIGKLLVQLGVEADPQKFSMIEATPSRMCMYCPFYRGGTAPADNTGCPGKTSGDPVEDLFG
jgi:hypothetical protein